jgi:enediyne biosynthesis protein E8
VTSTNPVTADDRDAYEYRTMTLEAFADTFVPGEKRYAGDRAIAGAAPGPGAVAAGAIELLETPATGVAEGLDGAVATLNAHAAAWAAARRLELDPALPPFPALEYADRRGLLTELTAPGHPEKDIWILVALFCFMAFDTAAHMHTADAIATGHPGLALMGFAKPGDDGLWRFGDYSYGRQLARVHPDTTPIGNPA